MNPKTIVLFSADPLVQEAVAAAVMEARHGLRLGATFEDCMQILQRDHSDVDVYIIDVDSRIHGVSLMTTLNMVNQATPVVVITEFEANYCAHLNATKGATACLGKPVSMEEIRGVLERVFDGDGYRLPVARNGGLSAAEHI